MKIVSYSDLHLEFRHDWSLPSDLDGDVLVLAGDIIIFKDFSPLKRLLDNWHKPVLFVAGNHEYYTRTPMSGNNAAFKDWLAAELPQVIFLQNEHITIGGVSFFGGTMWTDMRGGDTADMRHAAVGLNDYRYICEETVFTPKDSMKLHKKFATALKKWLASKSSGPRVVITHHAPIASQTSRYLTSPLQPAFVAYDMLPLIEKYAPDVWIYGHTHECDAQLVHKTKIISNQLGYPGNQGYECFDSFDEYGCMVHCPDRVTTEVKQALLEADAGDFATDEEMMELDAKWSQYQKV
jgi:predicted phosphodiesterase